MYHELCTAVLARYSVVPVLDYLRNSPENVAIFRHDVDKKPENALTMAELEESLGICSTYYFRTTPDSFNLDIINSIHEMGHEIGYHYEVLDMAGGDYDKAIRLFQEGLNRFPCEIGTICMHGNPLTPWDNRDIWSKYDFCTFGISGEAYLSLDFSKIAYFSDTGRAWHNRYSIKDKTRNAPADTPGINSTPDLIGYIPSLTRSVCIVTHPQRWNDPMIPWITELTGQMARNIGKAGIRYFKRKNAASP
jgi:hypothetical protein